MMEVPEYMDELITRVLEGSASAEEKLELENWRALNSENESYFRDMEFLYFATASVKHHVPVDVNQAWASVKDKTIPAKRFFLFRNSFNIAASLLLIALTSIGIYFYLNQQDEFVPYVLRASNSEESAILPDSTEIILGKGSKITSLESDNFYAYQLEGKASFSIHKSDKPFILHAQTLSIRDIGTVFSVDADPLKDTFWVEVSEGLVQLENEKGEALQVEAMETAFFVKSTQSLAKKEKTAVQKKASFQFDAIPLGEAIQQIKNEFGVDIQLDNKKLANCQIKVDFETERLETILEVICLTLNLELEHKENYYLILGTACTPDP